MYSYEAEKIRQQRSRIVQTLNVPRRVCLGPPFAAALMGGTFEHPAECSPGCATRATIEVLACQHSFQQLVRPSISSLLFRNYAHRQETLVVTPWLFEPSLISITPMPAIPDDQTDGPKLGCREVCQLLPIDLSTTDLPGSK